MHNKFGHWYDRAKVNSICIAGSNLLYWERACEQGYICNFMCIHNHAETLTSLAIHRESLSEVFVTYNMQRNPGNKLGYCKFICIHLYNVLHLFTVALVNMPYCSIPISFFYIAGGWTNCSDVCSWGWKHGSSEATDKCRSRCEHQRQGSKFEFLHDTPTVSVLDYSYLCRMG